MEVQGGTLAVAASAAAGLGLRRRAAAQQKEVLDRPMCDRTGPTQINGVVLCPAMHDYYNLINSKGGVEGYKIKSDGDRPRIQGPAGRRGVSAQ